jgi:hypothetical protein
MRLKMSENCRLPSSLLAIDQKFLMLLKAIKVLHWRRHEGPLKHWNASSKQRHEVLRIRIYFSKINIFECRNRHGEPLFSFFERRFIGLT